MPSTHGSTALRISHSARTAHFISPAGGNWRIRRVTLGPQRSLSLSIGNDSAFWGDLAEVTIDVGGSVCITSAEFSISYDETVLDPRSLILQPLVTDSSLNLEWVVESDVMNFQLSGGTGTDEIDGTLASIVFQLRGDAGRGTSAPRHRIDIVRGDRRQSGHGLFDRARTDRDRIGRLQQCRSSRLHGLSSFRGRILAASGGCGLRREVRPIREL